MSSLPSEIFSDITNFLPNDDITDLMLMAKTFNALVTPRLKKIDEDRATMNQSIKSPVPEIKDGEWIAQLDLKRFEPIGSVAKKRMKDVIERICIEELKWEIMGLKEVMSLERFDDATFLRILWALLAKPEFRQEYNISQEAAGILQFICITHLRYVILNR
ncbi:hypothetical protein DdX_20340 [Ditylenchus destructor]|uniref:F-box domain-containing protein n=1 Tax=Ditylenchus destructor TaxID=166010 RepID=A0AAD4MHD6_9BILA|nr:hypothetical protein DdX_20340 [Ditylenchus destructor]